MFEALRQACCGERMRSGLEVGQRSRVAELGLRRAQEDQMCLVAARVPSPEPRCGHFGVASRCALVVVVWRVAVARLFFHIGGGDEISGVTCSARRVTALRAGAVLGWVKASFALINVLSSTQMSARQVGVQERVDGSVGPPKQATALKKSAGLVCLRRSAAAGKPNQNTAL